MLIELGDRFEVLTNSQSEKGRPDITFIPKELVKDHRGYVFEFKFNNIRLIYFFSCCFGTHFVIKYS